MTPPIRYVANYLLVLVLSDALGASNEFTFSSFGSHGPFMFPHLAPSWVVFQPPFRATCVAFLIDLFDRAHRESRRRPWYVIKCSSGEWFGV